MCSVKVGGGGESKPLALAHSNQQTASKICSDKCNVFPISGTFPCSIQHLGPKPSELDRAGQAGAEFLPFKKILSQEGQTKRSFLAQGNEGRFWSQTAWVQVPTLPLAFWAMLGKLLYFLSLSFLSCEMGMQQDAETSPQKAMSSPHPVCHLIECSGTLVKNKHPHGPSP